MVQVKTKKSFSQPQKVEKSSNRCRICCFNFKVKFGTLSQAGESGFISSENLFKVLKINDLAYIYGTMRAEQLVVKNSKLFSDRVPVGITAGTNLYPTKQRSDNRCSVFKVKANPL